MNLVIQSSLSNIAIIFLMHLCIDILLKSKQRLPRYYLPFGMILLVSTAVICMFYLPIKFGGFQFDLRLIPLVFLAFKWGWRYALSALFIVSAWRLGMGGEGAFPGIIFGMTIPVLFTLLLRKIKKSKMSPLTLFSLIGAAWLISDLPIIILVPDGWYVFKEIAVLRFVSFQLTSFTLYLFIINVEKEIELREKLQYYAERDPLTGLYNIRYFETKVKSYPATNYEKYIIMIDIDHFKAVNDTYGHLNGDLIIRNIADVIVKNTAKFSGIDLTIGRYGGEEFILYMAVPDRCKMVEVVEAIRKDIEKRTFYTENKKDGMKLTVSIGVSNLENCTILQRAIQQADECLYKSKKNGRNQINYVEKEVS